MTQLFDRDGMGPLETTFHGYMVVIIGGLTVFVEGGLNHHKAMYHVGA